MIIGSVIRRLDVCTSTSDVAREMAEAGTGHGTAVVAEEQTMGRGTKGRIWHSPRGKGLYVSFVLRPSPGGDGRRALALLPLAAGLAGSDAVRAVTGFPVGLKWPNDLVWERLKFGGILSESVFRGGDPVYSIVGIGINVSHDTEDFPEALRPLSTSLKLIAGRAVEKESVLAHLCRALQSWYNALQGNGKEEIIRAYERSMAFSPGDRLIVTTNEGGLPGTFRGLGKDGRLRLEHPGGETEIAFEDIRALDWI